MLRNLLILVCLISTTNAIAQHTPASSSKTTEKQNDAKIDYKLTGAPMPPIKLLLYKDTTTKKDTTASAGETKHHPRKKKHQEYTKMPGDKYLTDKDLDNNANLFVMMFNPTCSHCQDETVIIRNNIALFKKTQLVLMANPVMGQYLPDFVNMLHVLDYPEMHVGIDSCGFIDKVFMYSMLPQINIYGRDRKLLKIYNGETPMDSLKKYIE